MPTGPTTVSPRLPLPWSRVRSAPRAASWRGIADERSGEHVSATGGSRLEPHEVEPSRQRRRRPFAREVEIDKDRGQWIDPRGADVALARDPDVPHGRRVAA